MANTNSRLRRGGVLAFLRLFCALIVFAIPAASAAERTVVIGDIHGDYDAYMGVLSDAGLIDKRGRWSGGDTRLVQLGDIPDRGPSTRRIMDHLMRLERQANRAGGEVVALIGNHEAMNVTGDLRYVTPEEYAEFRTPRSKSLRDQFFAANEVTYSEALRKREPGLSDADIRDRFDEAYPLGYVEHRQAWTPTGRYGRWVTGHDAVAVIDGTIFVHGGLALETAAMGPAAINEAVREALQAREPREIVAGSASPMWYRGNVKDTPQSADEVRSVLDAWNADRIIVGHTPNRTGIKQVHGGKVIMVDTGMSSYYGGTRSFLEIEGDTITAFDNGKPRILSGEAP